jgi:hypothetical protein
MTPNECDGPWKKLTELPSRLTEEEMEQVRDMAWAATDAELQDLYPDEYVAVYRRQVVAHGHDLKTLLDEAERITGLPRHKIAVTTILGPGLLWSPR